MISARIIADSVRDPSPRLTTLQLRMPVFIWPEMLTHRTLSRSARSMRAAPTRVFLREVLTDPAMPVRFGAAKPGMQDAGPLGGWREPLARGLYRSARYPALGAALTMHLIGVHKQAANRGLTAWAWIDAVVTGTYDRWFEFLALRDHDDADPTMREVARVIACQLAFHTPRRLARGEWHLPYVTPGTTGQTKSLSAARCARVSYAPHDAGREDVVRDKALADRLLRDRHLSPFEHQAVAVSAWDMARDGNLTGWRQCRKDVE